MGWTTLSERIDGLPLIISGPILRRVEKESVTVWIALKEAQTVRLLIMNSAEFVIFEKEDTTIQIGSQLHVLAITATTSLNFLSSGSIYFYNLEFNGQPMIHPNGELGDGILISNQYQLPNGISYANYKYPSFLLPADTINQLRFSHGSCRKPHGGTTDALIGLDAILENSTESLDHYERLDEDKRIIAINKRPQFLCLTGDQIYADDVADLLLFFLMDAGYSIMQIKEDLPEGIAWNDKRLNPGKRLNLVFSKASIKAKSNLIFLEEFYSMYLFIWSDLLWIEFEKEDKAFEKQIRDFFKIIYPNEPIEVKAKGIMDALFNKPIYNTFLEESQNLKVFKRSLKAVRKVLANIPTYMMFDDHEISDDWFLTRNWTKNALRQNSLVKRIIQNGLSAFTFFQAWGNNPQLFNSQNGRSIIEDLHKIVSNFNNTEVFESLGNKLLPKLEKAVSGNFDKLTGGFKWSFNINFKAFNLIFLDTRTKRGFRSNIDPVFINDDELSAFIKNLTSSPNIELAIVISPSPVFGNYNVEKIQEAFINLEDIQLNEEVKALYVDKEAWIFDRISLEKLLEGFSAFKKVLFISGDVHYGFSASIDYWDNRHSKTQYAAFGQLTASSIKNSGKFSRQVANIQHIEKWEAFGWLKSGKHIEIYPGSINSQSETLGPPSLKEITEKKPVHENFGKAKYKIIKDPDWMYRIEFSKDLRSYQERNIDSLTLDLNTSNPLKASAIQQHQFKWNKDRTIVGEDNIGLVYFEWNDFKVIHELWYQLEKKKGNPEIIGPYTKHILSLKGPDENTPQPKKTNR